MAITPAGVGFIVLYTCALGPFCIRTYGYCASVCDDDAAVRQQHPGRFRPVGPLFLLRGDRARCQHQAGYSRLGPTMISSSDSREPNAAAGSSLQPPGGLSFRAGRALTPMCKGRCGRRQITFKKSCSLVYGFAKMVLGILRCGERRAAPTPNTRVRHAMQRSITPAHTTAAPFLRPHSGTPHPATSPAGHDTGTCAASSAHITFCESCASMKPTTVRPLLRSVLYVRA